MICHGVQLVGLIERKWKTKKWRAYEETISSRQNKLLSVTTNKSETELDRFVQIVVKSHATADWSAQCGLQPHTALLRRDVRRQAVEEVGTEEK